LSSKKFFHSAQTLESRHFCLIPNQSYLQHQTPTTLQHLSNSLAASSQTQNPSPNPTKQDIMHLLQVVSILLGFIMASSALPKAPVANVAQNTGLSDRVNFADFEVGLFIYQTFIYCP
jgi:hypothetical protein